MEENNSPFSDFFKALRGFIKGKVSSYELENSDRFIYDVRYIGNNPGSAEILIDFKSGYDCLEFLGFDDDDSHFIRNVTSGYYEFFDYYSMKDDFKEGYGVFHNLNDENNELLKKIYVLSTGKKLDTTDRFGDREDIAKFFLSAFPKESEDLIDAYSDLRNEEAQSGAEGYIDRELTEYLQKLNMKFEDKYETVSISVAGIYKLISSIGDTSLFTLDLEDFLKEIIKEFDNTRPGRFYEDIYEYQGEGDISGFNRRVERIFEQILDDIEEEGGERLEIVKKLSEDFEFDKRYTLPKDTTYTFKIIEVERVTNKIIMELTDHNKWNGKKVKVSYENFHNFLYHPELFDLSSIFD